MMLLRITVVAALAAWPHLLPAQPERPAAAPGVALTDGEVRKVDRDLGRLTLRHGPLASLDMPAMTMVFRVADPKMLDGLKPGDRVRFAAERVGGAITVTVLQPVK